ncbi:MAG: SusC/RagA family TonB-linked outer membrane protein [Cyclobacteriaceae bacterium]|nr:SusC/RagA family TonB-linked outer membrane protein [Cyclobacteriaceae bacterium]
MQKIYSITVALLLFGLTAFAQQSVSGKVTDANGEALIGVNVIERGTSNGTITDVSGNFSMQVQSGAALQFSFIGYTSVSETVGARSVINVTLVEDVTQLSEVVVSALGFEQNKDKLGSTSAVVKAEDVARSGETGLLNGMAGKAAGVRIARSNGDPGAGSTIQIRGANTITGSSDPLFIVDGIPVSNSSLVGNSGSRAGGTSEQSRINDLNPEDIESIQVLKGASAAALWGSRAANGVVVITTKKGKAGDKVNISFSSTYSVDQINRRHPLQDKFGQGSGGNYSPTSANSWGDRIADRSGAADEVNETGRYFKADDGTIYYPITTKNSRETFLDENFDAVFQDGSFWENSLAVSGGGEKSNFYFSLGDLDQKGIVKNADYRRTTLRLNANTQFNDWMALSSKATYAHTSSNRIQQSSNVNGLYLGLLRGAPDFDNRDYKGTYFDNNGTAFPGRQRTYRRYLGDNQNATYNNPLWTTNELKNPSLVDRFIVSSEMTISPLSWMDVILRGGVDSYTDRRERFFPIGSAGNVPSRGELDAENFKETEVNFDAIVRGTRSLTSDINLNATIGWNINDRKYARDRVDAQQFLINTDLRNFNNSSLFFPDNTYRHRRSNRLYSVLAFDFYDQIFLNLNGTQEAASTIAGTFFYPAADVAWQFTQLPSLSGSSVISFGKLRLAYGQVGVEPQAYRDRTTYESFTYNAYDDGLDPLLYGGGFRYNDDKGNANLRPEVKTEFEIGTDLRLLKDKLAIGFTYYSNEINDLLFEVGLAPASGFNSVYANAGTMTNKGIELDANYTVFKNRDWQVNLYGNFNNNRNLVTDLKGTESIELTTQSISSRAVQGQALGVLWATRAQRNDDGSLVLDANGFPQIDPDQGVVGDPNPDWRGGLGLTTSYKGLSLNVLFETFQGGDYADRTRFVLYQFGTHADVGNEVTLTQDVVNSAGTVFTAGTTVRGNIEDFGAGPVLKDEQWYTSLGGGLGGSAINELAISDGSWTRLREISLSYKLNNAFVKRMKLTSVDLGITGRNLKLWTDVKGIDPEINQSGVDSGFGIDYFTNPSTRSWLFSIKVNY